MSSVFPFLAIFIDDSYQAVFFLEQRCERTDTEPLSVSEINHVFSYSGSYLVTITFARFVLRSLGSRPSAPIELWIHACVLDSARARGFTGYTLRRKLELLTLICSLEKKYSRNISILITVARSDLCVKTVSERVQCL